MSSKRRTHNVRETAPLLIGIVAVFLLSFAARAATLTGYSDLASRLAVNASANHELKFVTPSGVQTSADTLTITFESDFSLSGIVVGDIDFALDASVPTNDCIGAFAEKTLAVSAAASPIWGVGISGQTLTLSPPTDAVSGEVPAGTCVRVRIGTNATFGAAGTHQISNPSAAFAHTVTVGGGFGDTGTAYVHTNDGDQVTVTAQISSPGGGGGGGGGGNPSAPNILNVRTANSTETETDVLWETDVSSSSSVDYGLTTAYGNTTSVAGTTFNHNVRLSGLVPGTTYHYRVRTSGLGTPEATSGDYTVTTLDTTAPILSGIAATLVTSTSARIVWDTNEDANSRVDYGTTNAYGNVAMDGAFANAHTIDVSSLQSKTTYYFRVTSTDASGNASTSAEFTFLTADATPPTISAITVDAITETSARVNWTTDELSDSTVRYGQTTAYGTVAANGSLLASHQITLNGLAAGTLYHFSVSSADAASNGATSTNQTFTTLADTTPPANVSNLSLVPGDGQNALSWTLPLDADFAGVRIQRALAGYPTVSTAGTNVYDGTGTVTADTGLVNGTRYYYTVFAYDNSGNFSTGAIGMGTPFDTNPPAAVSQFTVTAGDAQNALAWASSISPDANLTRIQRSTIGFPTTPGEGTTIYSGSANTYLDTGLVNGATYYYAAFASDTSGNFSTPAQASGTPVGAPPASPVCGNAVCEPSETSLSCPADCSGILTPPSPFCGDAICSTSEEASSCPADCPVSPNPPVPVPPEETSMTFNKERLRVFALNRVLELHQNAAGEYRMLPNRSLTVFIPATAFSREPETLVLNFASGSYLFTKTDQAVPESGYVADVSAPNVSGLATGTVVARFADGTSGVTDFTVRVESFGLVLRDAAQRIPLDGVVVKVQKRVGAWIDWDALPYLQTNPVMTDASGSYAFMVPRGEYRLVATRENYRLYESAPFDVASEVLNAPIELIELPPSLTEVLVPGAPIIENITNVAKAIGAQSAYVTKVITNEIIQDPRVESTTTQVLVPAAAAATTVVVATAVQATSIVSYLYFLLTQPLLLIGRRKRKGYGVIYDALTKLPVDLATVRLFRASTNRLVRTIVTDKHGRYAFIAEPGDYRIEVGKPGFVFPTRYLLGRNEDAKFLDLYHGEQILVSSDGGAITANVPIDPVEKVKTGRRLVLEEFGRRIQNAAASLSVVITFLAAVFYQNIFLYTAAGLQTALYLLFRRLAHPTRPKNWGIIYDERTKKPIPFAVTRIVEAQYNKTLESRIADSKGRYNFLVGNSKYFVTVEKPGYEPVKTEELDLTRQDSEKGIVSRDIALREKKQ